MTHSARRLGFWRPGSWRRLGSAAGERLRTATASSYVLAALACQSAAVAPTPPQAATVDPTCKTDQERLLAFVDGLPDHSAAVDTRSDLPSAALEGVIGDGHTLDVHETAMSLDGQPVPGGGRAAQLAELSLRLEALATAEGGASAGVAPLPVYLSVAANTDAKALRAILSAVPRTLSAQLVFQVTGSHGPQPSEVEQISLETDPDKRQELTRAALVRWARCGDVLKAVDSVPASPASTRWPALHEALSTSLPHCACDELEVPELHALILAERRAGAASIGALPIDFMRDERCGASFGLEPVSQIVKDVEEFDEKNAGRYSGDEVSFESVLTNDRLLVDLCQALPGETLAALRREGRAFYWKLPGAEHCQAWRFEPIEPGSPMGTWRRQAEAGEQALAVHYWQGAEEIRLFGPVPDGASRPTDERSWDCSQDFALRGIDATSIELAEGRWFFDRPACEQTSAESAAFPGCISTLAQAPEEAAPDAVSEVSR